jgi:hypothetical protein
LPVAAGAFHHCERRDWFSGVPRAAALLVAARAKFGQHPQLGADLRATGDKTVLHSGVGNDHPLPPAPRRLTRLAIQEPAGLNCTLAAPIMKYFLYSLSFENLIPHLFTSFFGGLAFLVGCRVVRWCWWTRTSGQACTQAVESRRATTTPAPLSWLFALSSTKQRPNLRFEINGKGREQAGAHTHSGYTADFPWVAL